MPEIKALEDDALEAVNGGVDLADSAVRLKVDDIKVKIPDAEITPVIPDKVSK